MDRDYARIRVGRHETGIMGLKAAVEEAARTLSGKSEEQVGRFLLEKLSKRNYIAPPAREDYRQAFLREYRKHVGMPQDPEEDSGSLKILVVGPGCSRCEGLEQTVMDVMTELHLAADLEHVRDVKRIAEMGIMGSPALVVAGTVECVGSVPSRNRILEWLKPYAEQQTKEK